LRCGIDDRHDFLRQPAVLRWPGLPSAASAAQRRPGPGALTCQSAATFSPVSGMESTPYCAFISGLTKRQPMVVS
jgi:hypothetical protein